MNTIDNIIQEKQLLISKYAVLIEDAYNYMISDQALSDIYEFEAAQVMQRITKLDSHLSYSLA